MKNLLITISIFAIPVGILFSPLKLFPSQYQFFFHHYNDISSYSQTFFLPTQTKNMFSLRMDAFQSSNKNVTLSKEETASNIFFNLGFNPSSNITFNIKERASSNNLNAENFESRIVRNELRIESILKYSDWLNIIPYFLFSNDHYSRQLPGSVDIRNPGMGKGITANFDIKDVANISSELFSLEQSISNEKRGIVMGSFDKDYSNVRIGGNLEGRNILTQYPILNGEEEKFLESAKGIVFTEFNLFNRLTTYLSYDGSIRNEIYSLLSGYAAKHNNEKKNHNNYTQNLTYSLNPRISLDLNINSYDGIKTFQDGLNDEYSTVKSVAPAFSFKPNKSSEIKFKRILRLSSFSFPNPLTVTDRDILDKSFVLLTKYTLPGGTGLALSLMRTSNHIIYIKNEMSANNVNRTKYNIETDINYFVQQKIKIEEHFSLTANYQIYDFPSERNLFTRSLSNHFEIYILNFHFFEPSFRYKITLQDWGPYLLSYETGDYLYYRSLESKKETYSMTTKICPISYFAFTPSVTIKRNTFANLNQVTEKQKSSLTEEHYGLKLTYGNDSNMKINFDLTWIRRIAGDDFYELKTKLSYGV